MRKDTAPAIQSTVLPWKQNSYNEDNVSDGNNRAFNRTMNKPVKQQEFPPNWTAVSGNHGDDGKSSSGEY